MAPKTRAPASEKKGNVRIRCTFGSSANRGVGRRRYHRRRRREKGLLGTGVGVKVLSTGASVVAGVTGVGVGRKAPFGANVGGKVLPSGTSVGAGVATSPRGGGRRAPSRSLRPAP